MALLNNLKTEFAAPSVGGIRQAWTWRPLASMTPAMAANILRRAAVGDARDFLLAAADIEEKDLHYRAVLQTRKLAVAGLPLTITSADESRAARRAARLVEDALARLDVPELMVALLDALSKGYAVAEIVWDTDGGAWLPARIIPREAHWFRFDQATGRELRLIDGSADGQALPGYKFMLHTPKVIAGLPLMGGLARSALWAWAFKSYALRDWAAFCELYGQPIRVGKYDSSATPEDVATLRRAVTEIGSDAAAVVPASMMIELIESGGKTASADLYQRLIEYLDRQVSKAVLGQTLTTDQGSSGSLAQARVHDEVRADLMRADARALAATLARDLIAPIVRLNLGDGAPLPKIELKVEEPEDLAALAEQVQKLVAVGLPVPAAWVRERWGIPEAQPGEAVLGAVAPVPTTRPRSGQDPLAQPDSLDAEGGTFEGAPPAAQANLVARNAHKEAHAQADAGEDVTPIDPMAARMDTETVPAWGEIMDRIRAIVEQADSLEALRDALLAAYGDLPSDQLAEVMAIGFAAAELAGRYDVGQESGNG